MFDSESYLESNVSSAGIRNDMIMVLVAQFVLTAALVGSRPSSVNALLSAVLMSFHVYRPFRNSIDTFFSTSCSSETKTVTFNVTESMRLGMVHQIVAWTRARLTFRAASEIASGGVKSTAKVDPSGDKKEDAPESTARKKSSGKCIPP